ncbi:FecR family protein [Mangrovibacterium sp.]|uniref:FecR family protein n=1 Tax=Mangrovibacterium sp. TaxID=1961364 RepID=UPI0035686ECF
MAEKRKYTEAFRNYESGSYSRTDYKQVNSTFANDDELLREHLHEHWESLSEYGEMKSPNMKSLINQVQRTISPQKPSATRRMLTYYQRIAAVLLIPITLFSIYWFTATTPQATDAMATIVSPQGARTSFVLPDGSTGWLNSGSEISYPVNFHQNREVKLVGEAFFHVKQQNGEKFKVRTPGITVQVLGTQFNVSAYEANEKISVVLQEGSVQILDQHEQASYLMKPDERFEYNRKENRAVISHVEAADYTRWTEGLLQFRGESLEVVMSKLARWYNVDIEIRDEQLKAYNFKATFKDEQLDEILRMIALTTPMQYRVEERKSNLNSLYVKKKIIIEQK